MPRKTAATAALAPEAPSPAPADEARVTAWLAEIVQRGIEADRLDSRATMQALEMLCKTLGMLDGGRGRENEGVMPELLRYLQARQEADPSEART